MVVSFATAWDYSSHAHEFGHGERRGLQALVGLAAEVGDLERGAF